METMRIHHSGPDGPEHEVAVPRLGLGVWQIPPGPPTRKAVAWALEAGYRHVDTASSYRNEADVGQALGDSGVDRDDVFVTTKLQYTRAGEESTVQECRGSLERLDLDHVDLFLVHAPPEPELREGTWRAMERLLDEGLTRAVGVSNYGVHHLDEVVGHAARAPAMNQIERHPWLGQGEVVARCRELGMGVTAYSPLTQGHLLGDRRLVAVANRVGRTPAQVLIRWSLQQGCVVIPRSTQRDHIRENADVWDWELAPEDLQEMAAWDQGRHISWDPTGWP